MLKSFAWLYAPDLESVLFALRLVVAVSLALYLAMWLQLGRPFWSGLEVALMIQFLPGDTVARAAARVGGTLTAGVAALVILGLFRQTPELMIFALACWVSACAFGLQLFRNNLSHAFGVIGFITGVITMFTVSALSQASPFDVAQSRVAECCLAATVVAVVNVLFSTGMTARRYYAKRREVLRSVGEEMQAVIEAARRLPAVPRGKPDDTSAQERRKPSEDNADAPEDPHPRLAALARSVLALDDLRPYVRWEHPGFAAFDHVAQRMDRDLLSLTSAFSALHIYIARHGTALASEPLEHLADPAARLAALDESPARLKAAFDTAHDAISDLADRAKPGASDARAMDDQVVLGRALELAARTRGVLTRHEILVSEDASRARQSAPDTPGFSWPMNWPRVFRNSLASFTAVAIAGMFWLKFHDQTMSIIAVALGGAIATLFSATPSPLTSAANFAKGALVATLASFAINFFWEPLATGYISFLVPTVPVLFIGGLAMTQPSMALPARIMLVIFELTLHTQNEARIDFESFSQFVLGVYGAVGVAMLAFMLVIERNPEHQLRHQIRDVFRELARGLHGGSRSRFEARIYDRLNRLALLDAEGRHPYGVHQAVLAAVNLVLEARRLRIYVARAELSDTLKAQAQSMVAGVEATLQRRWALEDVDAQIEALNTLARALDQAAGDAQSSAARQALIGRAAISARLMASALADYADAARTIAQRAPAPLTA